MDDIIGELIDRCEPERVVVVSDHGMRLPEASDGGALVEIGRLTLREMWEDGARWLSSGTHSDRALCLASWWAEPVGLPRRLAEVLPWALTACGLAWEPPDAPSTADPLHDDATTPRQRETVLRRLRDLGYV